MVKLMFNHMLSEIPESVGAPANEATTKPGFSCYARHPHANEPLAEAVR